MDLDNPMDIHFCPFMLTPFLRFLDGLETMYELPTVLNHHWGKSMHLQG